MTENPSASSQAAPPDPESAPRPRIKKLEVMVAEVIRETPETATLVLFTGNDRLDYKPGHFLTVEPQQFPALERFIDYAQGHEAVWFCRRVDIARHWRKEHPFTPEGG